MDTKRYRLVAQIIPKRKTKTKAEMGRWRSQADSASESDLDVDLDIKLERFINLVFACYTRLSAIPKKV